MLIVLFVTLNLFSQVKSDVNKSLKMSAGHQLSLRNLCPYSKFCQSPPLKEIQDENYESCCEDCSCESDCFETGSCCPDMPLSGLVEPKYPCRHLWYFGKGVDLTYVHLHNRKGWFHVIDGCPDTAMALSYQRCYTPLNIIDYEIVMDVQTRKVYRNRHCAQCNGIRMFDKLKLEMECEYPFYMTTLTTIYEREEYIMANCSLRSLLPANPFGLSHCFPKSRLIPACNYTGNWETYNKEIEAGCLRKSYDQNKIFKRLSIYDEASYDYYTNVYCFLCNIDSSVYKQDTCEIFKDNPDSKSALVPFQVILSTKSFEEDPAETENARCTQTQMWDPYTSVCRNLLCPLGHIPENGECKGVFSNINGYAVTMHFEVTVGYGNITSHAVLLRFLEYRLLRDIGTDITCGRCSAALYAGKESKSQIYLSYEMYAKEGCMYTTLLERIRKLAIQKEMKLQFKFRNQVVRVMMAFVFKDIHSVTGYNSLAVSTDRFCIATVIGVTIHSYCPSFMLSSEERKTLGLTTETVYPVINDTNSFQKVCVETYFAARQANSAAVIVYFGAFKVFIILSMYFQQNVFI